MDWRASADGYDPIYYDRSPAENPTGPTVSVTDDRVLRGGGYDSPAEELRLTNRASERAPEFRLVPSVGFRCITNPRMPLVPRSAFRKAFSRSTWERDG